MTSADALEELKRFLKSRSASLDTLSVRDGIDAMIDFYRTVRTDDCDLESDGDMLLFQWGTYGRGRFEVDITRQFVRAGGEDEDIWQLSLTFAFAPNAIPSGNRWCASPAELEEFATFVTTHSALAATENETPVGIELNFEAAG
jgi:hypothetical protein